MSQPIEMTLATIIKKTVAVISATLISLLTIQEQSEVITMFREVRTKTKQVTVMTLVTVTHFEATATSEPSNFFTFSRKRQTPTMLYNNDGNNNDNNDNHNSLPS